MANEIIKIDYRFTLEDGNKEEFKLRIDAETMVLKTKPLKSPPEWTDLDFHQCPHCPLIVEEYPQCPVALNLVLIIKRFNRLMSYDKVYAEVFRQNRHVSIDTTAQEGLSSLMGLLIATSRCPHTNFFKPMARFHLPFATKEETIWRAASNYLLSMHFEQDHTHKCDIKLDGLIRIYQNIETLNDYMITRIRSASKRDSAVNALVHLDVFAKFLAPTIEESLDEIYKLFKPFLSNIEQT